MDGATGNALVIGHAALKIGWLEMSAMDGKRTLEPRPYMMNEKASRATNIQRRMRRADLQGSPRFLIAR